MNALYIILILAVTLSIGVGLRFVIRRILDAREMRQIKQNMESTFGFYANIDTIYFNPKLTERLKGRIMKVGLIYNNTLPNSSTPSSQRKRLPLLRTVNKRRGLSHRFSKTVCTLFLINQKGEPIDMEKNEDGAYLAHRGRWLADILKVPFELSPV